MHDIDTWFLVLGLIFPRIALFIAFVTGTIPYNTVPFLGDLFMAFFVPRILILIYIITCLGFGGWFVVHLIFLFLAGIYISKSKTYKKKI